MREDDLTWYDQEYAQEELTIYRKNRQKQNPPARVELAETNEETAEFITTYKPKRFEKGWLLSSLHAFHQQNLLRDVLYSVKGGKEASVYCCSAPETLPVELVAAKVYRPREFRNLRNDKVYRDGRPVLTGDGKVVKSSDDRIMRAMDKKTDFGMQVQHTSWLMYEYTTMQTLYAAGAAVPRPFGAAENAILMGYHGDRYRAAPPLSEVRLDTEEAEELFQEALRNIELFLEHGLIHGDLSAYNILYWEGKITVIDFPQVVSCQGNSQAKFILQRDITRVCDYFSHQGVECCPEKIMKRLWKRYGVEEPPPVLV